MIHGMNFGGKVKTSQSVLTPFFWIFSSALSASCFLFWTGNALPAYILMFIGLAVLAMFAYVYLHFMRSDPSKLHSETHIQHMQMIGTIGDPLSREMKNVSDGVGSNPLLGNNHEH